METAADLALTSGGPGRVAGAQVALLFHPRVDASRELAFALQGRLREDGAEASVLSAWDREAVAALVAEDLDLVVTLGGDGTMLRAARLTASAGVPIVGVNFGRLGYLTEIEPSEALERVPELVAGRGRRERRLMLECDASDSLGLRPFVAVNDVFIGRGRVARAVRLAVEIDGAGLGRFAADGLVVATPMGSTAYSLSAGGPVVTPRMQAIVLTPVVPHPTLMPPMVLPPDSEVAVTVETDDEATLSVDGQIHHTLQSGHSVTIRRSSKEALVLRVSESDADFRGLVRRLQGT